MDIRNTRTVKQLAAQRLASAPQEKKIVLIYSGITMGLALLVTLVRYTLGLQIDQMGGLSNLGARSTLSALGDMLPMAQSLFLMCLDLGYQAATLRIARGQYVSPQTLRLGFDRFWTLLRCSVFLGLLYAGAFMGSVGLGTMIFIMTPLSRPFLTMMEPVMADISLMSPQAMVDESLALEAAPTLLPMFAIVGILTLVFLLPLTFRYRLANYIIIDNPGMGALAALARSRELMRGNWGTLLKLDLSYWWYFGLLVLASLVSEGVLLLSLMGITLPMPADAGYFLFYILYLAAQMAVYCFLRNRMEVSYSLVYQELLPRDQGSSGIVLGNIFHTDFQ